LPLSSTAAQKIAVGQETENSAFDPSMSSAGEDHELPL